MRALVVLLSVVALIDKGLGGSPTAMIGIGEDNRIYTRSKENGSWKVASGETCCVIAVAQMPDGSLLGVGEDNQLYTKQKPGVGEWEGPVPRSCCLIDIAVADDGTIFGVNQKRRLLVRANLESDWVQPRKACCTKSVNIMPDGSLLGLARNGKLRIRSEVEGKWSYFKSLGPRMRDVSVDPSGAIYGVSPDTCGVYKLDGEGGTWEEELPSSECMLNIVSTDVLVPPNIES
ncbi:uncharacterized protein [Ptychodera flava]|uniref:uncharacterized protein n=1 Tax=Ptychodera flava TaxID=63121 RepID=UPI00396A5F66